MAKSLQSIDNSKKLLILFSSLQNDIKSSSKQVDKLIYPSDTFTITDYPAIRDAIIKSGVTIEHVITKISLAMGPELDGESCRGLCVHLFKSMDGLYKSVIVAKSCGIIKILRDTIEEESSKVTIAVNQFLDRAMESINNGSMKIAAQVTGVAWSACKALNKIPKSNEFAVKRHLLMQIKILNDTVSEFNELIEEGGITWDEEELYGELSEANSDDEKSSDMDMTTSEDDHTRLVAALALLKGIVKLFSRLAKFIGTTFMLTNTAITSTISIEDLKRINTFVVISKELLQATDSYACSLYPPHELTDVKDHTVKLSEHLVSMKYVINDMMVEGKCQDGNEKDTSVLDMQSVIMEQFNKFDTCIFSFTHLLIDSNP